MVIIFGTGYMSEIFMLYKDELNVKFFIDNDADKVGANRFLGYDVKSPEEIKNDDFDQIILASCKYVEEMRGQLRGLGVSEQKIVNIEDLDCSFLSLKGEVYECNRYSFAMDKRRTKDFFLGII